MERDCARPGCPGMLSSQVSEKTDHCSPCQLILRDLRQKLGSIELSLDQLYQLWPGKWLLLKEAAGLLGILPNNLESQLKKGVVQGLQLGEKWVISSEAVLSAMNDKHCGTRREAMLGPTQTRANIFTTIQVSQLLEITSESVVHLIHNGVFSAQRGRRGFQFTLEQLTAGLVQIAKNPTSYRQTSYQAEQILNLMGYRDSLWQGRKACSTSYCRRQAAKGCGSLCQGCHAALQEHGGFRPCQGCGGLILRSFDPTQALCHRCHVQKIARRKAKGSCKGCNGLMGQMVHAKGLCLPCYKVFYRRGLQRCAICQSEWPRLFGGCCWICWILIVRLMIAYYRSGMGIRKISARLSFLSLARVGIFLSELKALAQGVSLQVRRTSSHLLRFSITKLILAKDEQIILSLREHLSQSLVSQEFSRLASQLSQALREERRASARI